MQIGTAKVPMPKSLWKVIAAVLLVAGLAGQVWSDKIWNTYFLTLPRAANPTSGRTYADDSFHGIVVYETAKEHFKLYAVEYSSEASVAIGLMIAVLSEWKTRKSGIGQGSNRPRSHGDIRV
jgi:hypothetical protein